MDSILRSANELNRPGKLFQIFWEMLQLSTGNTARNFKTEIFSKVEQDFHKIRSGNVAKFGRETVAGFSNYITGHSCDQLPAMNSHRGINSVQNNDCKILQNLAVL